jgi:eukaryotic-like serine/threonine-protein kinase
VQGVGPGTVLGGRYDLRQRLSQGRDLERWSAHDATLEREVALTVVGAEHPNRAGVLDAARRAAGVEDTRLVRILDVGTQHDNSFIVEEALSESESLATILLQGPLPAEEARRVAGETARGLETAGQRGLHHLRLTPHYVMISPDGAIRVRGVAVAAAIDGPDGQEPDSATASRQDAVALVAVVYAALTSRWPLDAPVSDVEPAPRVVDGVVAPSEISAGVPGDLDALCRMTLNEANAPMSPGDFANRIAPWPRERVHRAGVEPTVMLVLPAAGTSDDHPASPDGSEPTVAISTQDVASHDPHGPTPSTPLPATPLPDQVEAMPVPTAADKAAAAGAATTKALGTAFASAGAAAGMVGEKLTSFGRGAGERAAAPRNPDHGSETMQLPNGLSDEIYDRDLPPAPMPMLPASTALPPSRGQSKLVVLVVAVFVGLALVFGFRGLLGPGTDTSLGTPAPRVTVTESAPAVTVPASPAPQSGATAAGPIAILSSTGFDPEGDKSEGNSKAARVYDANPATSWTSEKYATATFGNLKQGVGVLLDLGQPTSVHQVTVDLGSGPVDVTAYAATNPSLDGATVIGTASEASGQTTFKATKAMPEAQYVIVWFTKLAPDGGQFRASIAEIALS